MNESKEQLLEAAQKVFAHFGYRKTTLDDIAKVFGKGKTSIYYYFQGKDDVYKAVLDKEIDTVMGAMGTEVSNSMAPLDQVRAYVVTRMKSIAASPVIYDASNNESVKNIGFVKSSLQRFDFQKHGLLKRILTEGVHQQVLKPVDVNLAATAIETALKGLESVFSAPDEPVNMDQRIENLLNLLFYGLATSK